MPLVTTGFHPSRLRPLFRKPHDEAVGMAGTNRFFLTGTRPLVKTGVEAVLRFIQRPVPDRLVIPCVNQHRALAC